MDLNTRGRYAVMAIADLARACVETNSVSLATVAERQKISLAYLEQLFAKLRRANLVESERGRAGGYRLARPADAITIADVMAAVSENTDMTRCGFEASSPCVGGKRCITHGLWEALGDHIDQFLSSVTLQQVIDGDVGRAPHPMLVPEVVFNGGVVGR